MSSQLKSELSGVELNVTVQLEALRALIAKWQAEEAQEPEGADDERSEVDLQSILHMLTARLDGSQTYSFSSISEEHLEKLNIFSSGILTLNSDCGLRAAKTDAIEKDEHWSGDGLYNHLCLLERLFHNEAAARMWINVFFFRVASMLPRRSRFVLNVEQNVLPVAQNPTSFNSLSGFVNFTAILTTEAHAQLLLRNPKLKKLPAQDHALFVTEAKGPDQRLASHIPRAISEMSACAKYLEKTMIRGALTNGHEWIFFLLKLNDDGNGGKYFQSKGIPLMTASRGEEMVSRETSSLIAAIIAHWIQHSHEEIGVDDYFTTVPLP